MSAGRYAELRELLLITMISFVVQLISTFGMFENLFTLWLITAALLLAWIAAAARIGPARLRPLWLIAVAGVIVAYQPIVDVLPPNQCVTFGPCVV